MSENVVSVIRPNWRDRLVCSYLARGVPCRCFEERGITGVYHRFGYLMEYMHFFLQKAVDWAEGRGLDVCDFDGKCTRDVLKSDLDTRNPAFLVHGAHGAANAVTSDDAPGLDGAMLILLCCPPKPGIPRQIPCPTPNHDWLAGRVTYSLSCLSARVLGEEAVRAGAKAYMGWWKLLWVVVVRSELPGIASWDEACWDAAMAGILTLLNGGAVGEAHQSTYERFNHWLDYYLDPAHRDPYGIWLITCKVLLMDRDAWTFHGDSNARVATPVPVPWYPLALALGMAPLVAVATTIGAEEARKAGLVPT